MGYRTNTIEWVDLSTPDIDASLAFYSAVLGWTYQSMDTPMGTYHNAQVGGHDVAGLMQSDPDGDMPPAWTTYVRVASMGETMAAVTNANGSVVTPPFDIPGDAQVAVVADPCGATFAVIAGGPEPGPGEPPLRRLEPGAVAWNELLSRDPHGVINFYDAVFGWQAEIDTDSGYTMFVLADTQIGGLLPMPEGVPDDAPSYWIVYFDVADLADVDVDDVDRAAEVARDNGGTVVKAPTKLDGMSFAVLADNLNGTFGVMARLPTAAETLSS